MPEEKQQSDPVSNESDQPDMAQPEMPQTPASDTETVVSPDAEQEAPEDRWKRSWKFDRSK